MALALTNIPMIMRRKGWNNGARLMDIWFSRAGATAPAYGTPDTSTIKVDAWALKFTRAKRTYDQLISDRIWANPAAQAEIAKWLRKSGKLQPHTMTFGNFRAPVPQQDPDYINQRVIDMYNELDDMSAALGRFAFRVVIAGQVDPNQGGGFKVTIREVGVYIRDSYDFNGDQHLGYWDDNDYSVSTMNPFSGTRVTNKDFRDYRAKTGKGGDFLVYSDLKRILLPVPDTFVVR